MSTVVLLATWVALGGLFALLARYQFIDAAELRHHRNPLGLLTHFRLFSPNPVRNDLHLLVREFGADGRPRPLRELAVTQLRLPRDVVWHPNKREWLPLRRIARELEALGSELGDQSPALAVSSPYLVLLGFVSRHAAPDAAALQFVLVERYGFDAEDHTTVRFCSAIHRRDAPTRAEPRRARP